MSKPRIKVLIVEDSNAARMLLTHILRSDPRLQVIGAVDSGEQALEFLTVGSPDVILMDIEMPRMNGFEATRRIMSQCPAPIVICSAGGNPRETLTVFRSLEAGALACVEKPVGIGHKDFAKMAAHLLATVKLMSEVKVVRRLPKRSRPAVDGEPDLSVQPPGSGIELIAMGASTGGPPVLQTILAGLPRDFPVPLLVVQHIAPGFLAGLVQWLAQTTGIPVHIAAHRERPLAGNVYLAPDECHMVASPAGEIRLNLDDPDYGVRPSVAHLFDSMADVYGPRAVGVLLTGMGKDGARQLGRMKSRGACTIAQDQESSVVHGMPGEAIALGAATWVLPANRIASVLMNLVRRPSVLGESHEYSGSIA